VKIAIVNDQDEVIKTIEWDQINYATDIYRVAALWVVKRSGNSYEVLIAQRALDKKQHPGLWGPSVAGTVESEETYRENIIKETEEEIGLCDINPIKLYKEKKIGQL
jgi:isopentenyldiphosphate isomerase